MDWITIFKREKPKNTMPEPNFENNWKQEQFEKNVKRAVESLRLGKTISIMDDGRGYELALEIKRQFILEYQRQLAEQIKIEGIGNITIKRVV
jgi:hypothetical protein